MDQTLTGGQELYEPLWEDLLAESKRQGFRIRSIIIADAAWQGVSGQLNASKLGNDREPPLPLTLTQSPSSFRFSFPLPPPLLLPPTH